jgi:tetratricopeptide (TPR) repeat protein
VTPLALTILLGLVLPAAAQGPDEAEIDHETWNVIGWNDACGVAFERFYYPKLRDELANQPASVRIGTADIPAGSEKYTERWTLQADGTLNWDARLVAKTEQDLRSSGYARPGFPETIADAPIGGQPGLAETILSTATLSSRLKSGWPEPEWRWAGASYSPLGTCALLSYEDRGRPRRYRLLLVRVYNPRARLDRAYAHASNARLLFDTGDLAVAAPEAETAAKLAPKLPIARYEHAAMLALTGNADAAAAELSAAIKLEPKYGARARDDIDFEDLKGRQDYQEMTKPPRH